MTDESKVSQVGDYLGTIEEFVPGEGTFSEDGKIYAAQIGKAHLDREKHTASVDGKEVPKIKVGDTIFGEVVALKKSNIIVEAGKIVGKPDKIKERTLIYVSNIDDKFVDKPESLFALGDIVKAKVIKMDGNLIDLSTKGAEGVVKAFCRRCRNPLAKSEKVAGKLECKMCGSKESRKIAADYGSVKDI